MSTGIDIQFVRENYQRLSDSELIQAATRDAVGLTPEALQVVKEEIARRNLGEDITKGVEAQNRKYTVAEVDTYCDLIRNLECPTCRSTDSALNGTLVAEVVSFLVLTQYSKKLKVGCPACLDKANNNAKTAVLGWWGIPWGIIRSAQALSLNADSKNSNHLPTPNRYLRSFALSNIGALEAYKDNKAKLQQLIDNG